MPLVNSMKSASGMLETWSRDLNVTIDHLVEVLKRPDINGTDALMVLGHQHHITAENSLNSPPAKQGKEDAASRDGRSVHQKATATELRDLAKSLETDWVSIAARLKPELFSVKKIKVIQDKHKNDAYLQARAMLEDWSNSLADKGTRKLLIEALVKEELRLQANEVFSENLVNQVCPQV
ncbi:uncharacterized protein LOC134197866 [Corticium candelabrum]|uniref:uncharacterized protein LOC134197866 n=1 Tax=Corticium candelabrum TaxID=121492 RepID=UPI002E25770E|nr:uncharacterized protein LOC134197866 [Corticium candelabrum]